MLGEKPKKKQIELFRSQLSQIISPNHELALLAGEIDWDWIENELKGFYSKEGRSSVPIRTMVGMLLLKQLYNQSDESVLQRWVENPYWQYFTGETYFQHISARDEIRRYNKTLKAIGVVCGIEHPLTSYVARHSFATIAKFKDVPVPVIFQALGHSNVEITEVYLAEFDNDVMDKYNEMIIGE